MKALLATSASTTHSSFHTPQCIVCAKMCTVCCIPMQNGFFACSAICSNQWNNKTRNKGFLSPSLVSHNALPPVKRKREENRKPRVSSSTFTKKSNARWEQTKYSSNDTRTKRMSTQPPKKKHKPNNTVQQPAAMSVSPGFRDIMPTVQYVVIDTNNFMQYLEDVLQLRNQTQFTVIVPLTVVQELDGLKKQDDEVGFTARTALKHIHQVLTSGERWLRCQTSSEVPLSTANFGIPRPAHTKNDDTILNCALFLRSLHNVVALVTSDFALAVKAISAGMHTCDMKGLLQCLPPLSASPTAAFVPREPTTDPAEREAAARPQVVKITEPKEDIPGFAFTSQTPTNYYGEDDEEEEEFVNPELQQQYQQQYEKYQQQLQKEQQLAALNSDSTGMELDGPVLHEGLTEDSWLNILSYLTTEDLLKLKIVSKFWYRMSKNESLWQKVITIKFCCGKEDMYKVLTKNKPPMLWYLTWRQSILPVRPSAVEQADDKKKADYTFFF